MPIWPAKDLLNNDFTSLVADVATAQADATEALSHEVEANTEISPAQIRALHATPITIDPAPAGTKFLHIKSIQFFLKFNTAPHDNATADGNLRVRIAGTADPIAVQEAAGLIDAAADTAAFVALPGLIVYTPANGGLLLDNDGAAFTGVGDSPLRVRVIYRELDLGL